MAANARAENDRLSERIDKLEAAIAKLEKAAKPATKPAAKASSKPAAGRTAAKK